MPPRTPSVPLGLPPWWWDSMHYASIHCPVPVQEVVSIVDICRWYVSAIKPECGKAVVDQLTAVPLRNGKVKKLDRPMSVCAEHKAEADRRFAALRTHS